MTKRFIILILIVFPFFIFGQGNPKSSIDWISLNKAEEFAEKYNKDIFLFFYRPGCDFCEKMKQTTLKDQEVIRLINENFFPVMLNGKSKRPMTYNGKEYINEHPAAEDAPWRHNLYVELVDPVNGNYYWPDVVILNGKHEKITQFPGFLPAPQLLRNLRKFIKK